MHETLTLDVTAKDAPDLLLETVHSRLGGLDVLVNNAGVSRVHTPSPSTASPG